MGCPGKACILCLAFLHSWNDQYPTYTWYESLLAQAWLHLVPNVSPLWTLLSVRVYRTFIKSARKIGGYEFVGVRLERLINHDRLRGHVWERPAPFSPTKEISKRLNLVHPNDTRNTSAWGSDPPACHTLCRWCRSSTEPLQASPVSSWAQLVVGHYVTRSVGIWHIIYYLALQPAIRNLT